MPTPNEQQKLSVKEKMALSVVGILVVTVALAVSLYFMTHRPKPNRKPPPETAPLVEVQTLQPTAYQVVVSVMGTVIPAVEANLQAQVSGEIIATHPEFIAGGMVKQGETLLQIDPVDYQLALADKQAQLETARYELLVEQGQQDIARREWELMGLKEEATELDRELALRKPHLRAKQANLEAAQAEVARAGLDLERTAVKAPFNAIVQSTNVNIGDQATSQTTLATLVLTDAYWVRASIPQDQLRWIHLPDGDSNPQTAARVITGTDDVLPARLLKLLSDLEPDGRLAQLLIEVKDPLSYKTTSGERIPLFLGEYVRVEIIGLTLKDVFVIPRDTLRDGSLVWVVDPDNRLRVIDAEVVRRDVNYAVLRGLEPGARLIISDIAAPVDRMPVRIMGAGESGQSATPPAEAVKTPKPATENRP